MQLNRKDLATALIFLTIAGFFGISATLNLDVGTAFRMGPAYFPLVLSGLLVLLSLGIIAKGVAMPATPFGHWPWRGVLLILAAPIVFGALIRGAGLAPAAFVTCFITAMASRRMTVLLALALSAGLTVFCVLVFAWGLKLPVSIFGRWFGY